MIFVISGNHKYFHITLPLLEVSEMSFTPTRPVKLQKLLDGLWKCGISLPEEIASIPVGGHVAILCTGGAASGQ